MPDYAELKHTKQLFCSVLSQYSKSGGSHGNQHHECYLFAGHSKMMSSAGPQMRLEEDVSQTAQNLYLCTPTAVAASTEMLWLCTRCDQAPKTATATLVEGL